MSRLKRLERLCNEWNQSQHDMLNPQSLSTKIYSEEDPLTSTGVLMLGDSGLGSGNLVVPDDVVDLLKDKEERTVGGGGFVTFLKNLLKDDDIEDVYRDTTKHGGTYYELMFPGNKIISVAITGEVDGEYQLCVIYTVAEDERLVSVKDLPEGVFDGNSDVAPDLFPVDWFIETVRDALGEFDGVEEGEEDNDEDMFMDKDSLEDDLEDDSEDFGAHEGGEERPDRERISAGGRGTEGAPRESLNRGKRFIRYGGIRYLTD